MAASYAGALALSRRMQPSFDSVVLVLGRETDETPPPSCPGGWQWSWSQESGWGFKWLGGRWGWGVGAPGWQWSWMA